MDSIVHTWYIEFDKQINGNGPATTAHTRAHTHTDTINTMAIQTQFSHNEFHQSVPLYRLSLSCTTVRWRQCTTRAVALAAINYLFILLFRRKQQPPFDQILFGIFATQVRNSSNNCNSMGAHSWRSGVDGNGSRAKGTNILLLSFAMKLEIMTKNILTKTEGLPTTWDEFPPLWKVDALFLICLRQPRKRPRLFWVLRSIVEPWHISTGHFAPNSTFYFPSKLNVLSQTRLDRQLRKSRAIYWLSGANAFAVIIHIHGKWPSTVKIKFLIWNINLCTGSFRAVKFTHKWSRFNALRENNEIRNIQSSWHRYSAHRLWMCVVRVITHTHTLTDVYSMRKRRAFLLITWTAKANEKATVHSFRFSGIDVDSTRTRMVCHRHSSSRVFTDVGDCVFGIFSSSGRTTAEYVSPSSSSIQIQSHHIVVIMPPSCFNNNN